MDINPSTNQAAAGRPRTHESSHSNGSGMMKMGLAGKILAGLIGASAVVFIISGGIWMTKVMQANNSKVVAKQYQALFLSNGQVYFGKLSDTNNTWVKMTDIYYLQVQQSVQPADKSASGQQPQVSLAKLGNELHGPQDAMYVARSQILFWENLKDDGKVVSAIKNAQKNGNK